MLNGNNCVSLFRVQSTNTTIAAQPHNRHRLSDDIKKDFIYEFHMSLAAAAAMAMAVTVR